MSYRAASIPFPFIADDQAPMGYAYDICLKVVDEVHETLARSEIALKTQMMSGASRTPLLLNGTIDLECGSTTNTLERQSQVAFSTTYFVSGNRIMVKKGAGIYRLDRACCPRASKILHH